MCTWSSNVIRQRYQYDTGVSEGILDTDHDLDTAALVAREDKELFIQAWADLTETWEGQWSSSK